MNHVKQPIYAPHTMNDELGFNSLSAKSFKKEATFIFFKKKSVLKVVFFSIPKYAIGFSNSINSHHR